MQKILFLSGSIFGFLSVLLGAFAAHGLKKSFDSYSLDIFEVGVKYQMYHALALLAVSWASTVFSSPLIPKSGSFFIIGIIIFSGSLYLLAFTGMKWFGAITPIGGLSLLVGWGLLIFGVIKSQ